jgi:hypothetical protein
MIGDHVDKRMHRFCYAAVLALLVFAGAASPIPTWSATGCDLNYPDRDVARLFPGSTRYTTKYVGLHPNDLAFVLSQLDERYRSLYEPLAVPYTLYEIYNKDVKIGYIHGVNHKGQFGGIQVFIVQDLAGTILSFYIQKMTGVEAAKFRDAKFCKRFEGISLKSFTAFDPITGKGAGPLAGIRNPAPSMETDFLSVLRALKKNLVLMDVFVFNSTRKNQKN